MQLIIVESPTKSKTIKKFLGSDFEILSSYGHVRDLPKSKMGVDIENNFDPQYIIPLKARKVIKILKESLEKSDSVILATDEDREGEAIAWHLSHVLKLDGEKSYQRIVFHEITESAIKEALKNPRKINLSLVNAQQARRILDRIVGYKLSPFLWKKVMRRLSAGRVQSVVLRLVAEREREIESFTPQEYWELRAFFLKLEKEFVAILTKIDEKSISKPGIETEKETKEIVKDLEGSEFKVTDIKRKEVKRNPFPPFNTSTLQQESWKKFKLPARFTMMTAQRLYEKGFITYHRTDSLNLSELSLFAAKKFITSEYGEKYWAGFLRKYKSKGRAQEAHEAIRPTYPDKEPEKLKTKEKLDHNQFRLYDLIWRRFIASQMAQAVFDSTSIEIKAKKYTFQSTGQVLKFEGFLKVYSIKFKETDLPILEESEALKLTKLEPSQHFTKPPARFTEAMLIKELEKNGIGRPSTYAPTLTTVQTRNYIKKNEEKRFQPTEIGFIVNDLLVEHFPKIIDIKFTANMEKDLDEIAEGKKKWVKVLKDFYTPFEENLAKKEKEVVKKDLTEETDKTCPKCKAPLVLKFGRFGKFYACSKFPECKYTENFPPEKLGVKCPKCEKGEIVQKTTKRGKTFYGCSTFPKCDFALWNKPTGEKCQGCNSLLVENRGRTTCSNKECNYSKKDED